MNGITYFRLISQYEGDVTKNCALTGSEVDNNFYTLEGRDIKSLELLEDKIVITLMNGNKLTTDKLTEGCVKDLSVDFDEVNGILTITQNGITQTITGFTTNYNIGEAISTDATLIGNGLPKSPVGISPIAKTGQYRPVKCIVNVADGEKLPSMKCLLPGDRFLTVENVNDYGYLYNYEGLKKIACKLRETHSEWRIPTKQDWDDMLNAVEPNEDFRNHDDQRSNKFLGKFAGKLLKTKEYWKKEDESSCDECDNHDCCADNCEHTCIDYAQETATECNCGTHTLCHPDYCGEYGHCHYKNKKNHSGIDKYCFSVIPAGYANEAKDFMYFNERAYFWTGSNHEFRDAYIKAFAYNRSDVLQDILASDNYLSVRLVKDFRGDNFNEREEILGTNYSAVLMPSVAHGKTIWTSVNVALAECACDCCCKYVLPNDGDEVQEVKRFFTNEWNGKEWLRKELADGESVVVINEVSFADNTDTGNNDDCHCHCHDEECDDNRIYTPKYIEYRVVNGELVDVAKINAQEIEDRLNEIQEALQNEIERSTEKDNAHDESITTITNNVQTLSDGLEAEINRSTEKDNAHDEAIATLQEENQQQTQDIEDLRGLIEGEINRSTEKDAEHDEKINELDGKILTEEGTVFNTQNGVLTLKSKDGTNDIDVQFNFNFGTF